MPRIQLLLPLLRPLAAPRRAASQQLFRFSTVPRLRIDEPIQTPKSPAPTAQPAVKPAATPSETPKSSSPEAPSPSRAADLAATEAATEADSAQSPAPKPVLPSERLRPEKSQFTKNAASPAKAKKPADSRSVKDSTSTPKASKPIPPKRPQRPQIQLPPPKYHVARSSSNNLPIYTDYKRGGNLHLTTIRKITGDLSALRDEMRVFLNKKDEDVKINSLTQHVVIKGFHKKEIADFLTARGM